MYGCFSKSQGLLSLCELTLFLQTEAIKDKALPKWNNGFQQREHRGRHASLPTAVVQPIAQFLPMGSANIRTLGRPATRAHYMRAFFAQYWNFLNFFMISVPRLSQQERSSLCNTMVLHRYRDKQTLYTESRKSHGSTALSRRKILLSMSYLRTVLKFVSTIQFQQSFQIMRHRL